MHSSLVMGILNITPDSFSDGYIEKNKAIARGLELLSQGVHILDLGAESSRPGAEPLSWEEEWSRLEPVLGFFAHEKKQRKNFFLSVDSYHQEVIHRALDYGLDYVNHIHGLFDSSYLQVLAKKNVAYIAMHCHGSSSKTMQNQPLIGHEALTAVEDFFGQAHKSLLKAGFSKEQIWLDPGIGFGKDDLGNLLLLKSIPLWAQRWNITVGVSRKSFLGRLLDIPQPQDRQAVSTVLETVLTMAGAKMIRVHDGHHLMPILCKLQEM